MSEPETVYRWEDEGHKHKIVFLPTGDIHAVVQWVHPNGRTYWRAASDDALASEILRLSAELREREGGEG